MNKLTFFVLSTVLSAILSVSACYKTPSANTSRTSRETSPTAEKSDSPTPPTSPVKGGNYEQALKDYNSKNFDQAEKGFKEVLDSEPKNADAHYYLGNIYYARKDLQTSLPHYEQAAKIDFKSVEKLMALGDNQRALKQFNTAIVQYQKVIGFAPENADAYYALGLTYIGLNNKIAARQQLQKLAALNKSLGDKLSKEIDGMK